MNDENKLTDFSQVNISLGNADTWKLTDVYNDTISVTGGSNTIDLGNYTYTTASNWNNTYTTSWGSATNTVDISANGIDIKESGDIKIGNRSLKEFMEKMEQRLAILQPDPELLDKFEALRQAYEHYKTLEALCMGDIPKRPDGF